MTDQRGQGDDAVPAGRRHGEHEPGPGTVPAADLLAALSGAEPGAGGDEDPHDTPDPVGETDGDKAERGDADDPAGETDGGEAERGDADDPVAPTPVLVADELGLHTGHGWVFRDVTLEVPPATVTAIVGPAGTGRSSLLLALTGRMRVTDGTLAIAGRSVVADPRAARGRTAVARIADVVVPEERLTIQESIVERCLIEGVRRAHGENAFRKACEQMAVTFDDALLVEELAPHLQSILALALAAIRPADLIVLDDTDRGTTTDGEREIYRAAVALAQAGPAIVTTTSRREAVGGGAIAVPIAGSPHRPVTAERPPERPVTAERPPDDPVTAEQSPETPAAATTEDER